MARIRILPESLANLIAAGEAIERPASVLKELVENAIDANARAVRVAIRDGGIAQLEVVDDGDGIDIADLPVALQRHATSKLPDDDLENIATMGFRGEALASLVAVAQVTLASRTGGHEHGWMITGDGKESPAPCAMAPGTRVSVHNLFSKIPARRKFLRTPQTERGHCINMFRRLAIAYPYVGFELTINDNAYCSLSAVDDQLSPLAALRERCQSIFPELVDRLSEIDEEGDGIRLQGFIAATSLGDTARRLGQYFYVNRRYVQDRLVRRAIGDATRRMTHGGEPATFLFLTIDHTEVDVNVHPSKLEVRFRDSNQIFSFIRAALSKATEQPLGMPVQHQPPPMRLEIPPTRPPPHYSAHPSYHAPARDAHFSLHQARNDPQAIAQTLGMTEVWSRSDDAPTGSFGADDSSAADRQKKMIEDYPLGFALGQLHDIYILAENKQGLVIIDMHAAHERILFEQLRAAPGTIAMQGLIEPIRISISAQQQEAYDEALLCELGFKTKRLPEEYLELVAIPAISAGQCDPPDLLLAVIDDIVDTGGSTRLAALYDKVASTISCHCAVRANYRLNGSQMNALLREMEQTERSGSCNHGRPCWQVIDRAYFDSVFKRGR